MIYQVTYDKNTNRFMANSGDGWWEIYEDVLCEVLNEQAAMAYATGVSFEAATEMADKKYIAIIAGEIVEL